MKRMMMGALLAASLPVWAQATEYKVEMKSSEETGDVYFEPKKLEIKSGDTVIFTHADPYNVHNIMFEPNGVPKEAHIPMMSPEEMEQGDTWKVTFTKSGTYKYHCHPHYDMGMMGEIIVDRPSKPGEMAEGADDHHHHTDGHESDETHHH